MYALTLFYKIIPNLAQNVRYLGMEILKNSSIDG